MFTFKSKVYLLTHGIANPVLIGSFTSSQNFEIKR